MSPTQRDGRPFRDPQSDTRTTAESRDPDAAEPNPHEDHTMDETTPALGIAATLRRMALVRRNVLSVNGAYHAPETHEV